MKLDLTGQQFRRLFVLERAPANKHGQSQWRCRCDCGAEIVTTTHMLRRARRPIISCGCRKREVDASHPPPMLRHGHARQPNGRRSPTYSSWIAMNARCNRPTAPDYERYGGRGITICARWGSFEAFLEDMGERPAGLTLDRKDNGGNYEKSNCRWATAAEQNRNTRASKLDATKAAEARHLIAGGRSRKAVARMLDVSPALISYIASGKRWALARAK